MKENVITMIEMLYYSKYWPIQKFNFTINYIILLILGSKAFSDILDQSSHQICRVITYGSNQLILVLEKQAFLCKCVLCYTCII